MDKIMDIYCNQQYDFGSENGVRPLPRYLRVLVREMTTYFWTNHDKLISTSLQSTV